MSLLPLAVSSRRARITLLPVLLMLLCGLAGPGYAATIAFACGAVGTEFEEAGIPHRLMALSLDSRPWPEG